MFSYKLSAQSVRGLKSLISSGLTIKPSANYNLIVVPRILIILCAILKTNCYLLKKQHYRRIKIIIIIIIFC